jgi:hypothetical protein
MHAINPEIDVSGVEEVISAIFGPVSVDVLACKHGPMPQLKASLRGHAFLLAVTQLPSSGYSGRYTISYIVAHLRPNAIYVITQIGEVLWEKLVF